MSSGLADKSGGPQNEGYTLQRNLVAGILALVVAFGIGRFAYTPILPVMQERFTLTNAAVGALASSNYLGYVLGAIFAAFVPTGRWQDTLLRSSLLIAAVSTGLMALTSEFSVWLVLRFLAGLTSASIFVFASSVVLGELTRRARPELSGRFYSGVGLGIVLSGLVVLLLNSLLYEGSATWWIDWICLGALAALLVIPCWAWLPKGEADEGEAGGDVPETRPIDDARRATRLSSRIPLTVTLLGVAYFVEGGGYIVTGTFLPTIVERSSGLGSLGVGTWIVVGLAAVPSTVLWAKAASRIGPVWALVLAYITQALGIVLPVVSSAWWVALISAALFGGTFMGIIAVTLTYARQLVPARRADLTLGILTAAFGIGQVLGPLVAAALAGETGGFDRSLVAASAAVALGSLLMLFVGARQKRTSAEEANRRAG